MSARIIQVRPSRNPRWQKQVGWQVFEAEGVCPVYCGPNARFVPVAPGVLAGEIRARARVMVEKTTGEIVRRIGWSGDRGDYYVTLRDGVVVEYGAEQIRPGQKPVVIVPMPPIQ